MIRKAIGALALVGLLASCALTDWDGDVEVKIKHPHIIEFAHAANVSGDMVAHNYGSRTRTATCEVRVFVRMAGGAVIERDVQIRATVTPGQTVRRHLSKRISWTGTAVKFQDPKLVC
jgi:hypothetical protein